MSQRASAKCDPVKKSNLRFIYGGLRREIESKPLEGIPDYRPPIEQSLRCLCGLRYVVFTGGSAFDSAACEAAKGRAQGMDAQFIDARIVPFMQCRCGASIDFTTRDSCELVM